MPRRSAGLLMYRERGSALEVLLGHPGGPFWKNKDDGAWSIPKGEIHEEEDALAAAKREFAEETGLAEPVGPFVDLGEVRQAGGKIVRAWAFEGDADAAALQSNLCRTPGPPKSGRWITHPEIDGFGWFDIDAAKIKILSGQVPLLERLRGAAGSHETGVQRE